MAAYTLKVGKIITMNSGWFYETCCRDAKTHKEPRTIFHRSTRLVPGLPPQVLIPRSRATRTDSSS